MISYKSYLFENFTHNLAKKYHICDKISPRCAELNAVNATWATNALLVHILCLLFPDSFNLLANTRLIQDEHNSSECIIVCYSFLQKQIVTRDN